MGPIIGIDLGTTTSEIAVYQNDNVKVLKDIKSGKNTEIIPSIIAFDNKSRQIKIGHDALGFLEGDTIQEIKREMGNSIKVKLGDIELSPQEISAIILKKVIEVGEDNLNERITEAVITVPANFPIEAKKATEVAAEQAGLKVLRIIQEPTAAALAYSKYDNINDKIILIYDLGGGTFDVSIGELIDSTLEILGHDGDRFLGGKDFDEILVKHAISNLKTTHGFDVSTDKKALLRIKYDAKRVKEELSFREFASFNLPYIGLKEGQVINLDLEITRSSFEQMIMHLINRSIELTKSAISNAKLTNENINKIILVGGSSRIPLVKEKLTEFFGREPECKLEPDLVVSMGAAIQASIIKGQSDHIILDKVAYGFGINSIAMDNDRLIGDAYSEIIPPNSAMNKEFIKEFTTLHDEQDTVELKCYQREASDKRATIDGLPQIGETFIIDSIPTVEGMLQKVIVSMTYNLNGLIDVVVRIPSVNDIREFQLQTAVGKASEAGGKERKEFIDKMWENSKYADKAKSLINAVEKRLDKMDNEDRNEATKFLDELKQALVANNKELIDELEEKITDILINY